MSEKLDGPGAKVVEKLRANGLEGLKNKHDLFTLAKYVTALEARNPKTIEKMRLSKSEFESIRENCLPYGSAESVSEVVNSFRKIDTGKLGAGLFVPMDMQFAHALLECSPLELKFTERRLVTSDYPVGRVGEYGKQFMLSLAIAPNHAVLWFSNAELLSMVRELPEKSQADLVNFLTLGDAEAAFTIADEPDAFVSDQIGWKNGLDNEEQKKRVQEVIGKIIAEK